MCQIMTVWSYLWTDNECCPNCVAFTLTSCIYQPNVKILVTCGYKRTILFPSPPVDNFFWAIVIVWRIRGKTVRTVLCCILYYNSAQWYVHTYKQFLQATGGLGLLLYVYLLPFCFCVVCFFVLDLVSSIPSQEVGWEERLRNDLICAGWAGRKTLTQ